MEDKLTTNHDEPSVWSTEFSRDGKNGEIRGRFWATRDGETGELTFYSELPNVIRHFQEDFDVCILVMAWGLWGLAGKLKVWFHEGKGLSENEDFAAFLKTTEFIGYGIEAWLHKQGKLALAEGIVDRDGNLVG
jgi:hypothetical protein